MPPARELWGEAEVLVEELRREYNTYRSSGQIIGDMK